MPEKLFDKTKLRVLPVGRNLDDLLPLLAEFPCTIVDNSPDVIISHGGDGTLLGAERSYPGVPKFPLRDRKNNPKCPRHSEKQMLTDFFAGRLVAGHLVKLRAETAGREPLQGINDIVISRDMDTSAIRFRVMADGQILQPRVISDSVIISTPFGSTGYFLSITRGSFRTGIGLAYNNPMDGESFNIVPHDCRLEIELLRGPALLGADNNPNFQRLENGECVVISAEDASTPVYGLEAFRCHDCYLLRRNGIPSNNVKE